MRMRCLANQILRITYESLFKMPQTLKRMHFAIEVNYSGDTSTIKTAIVLNE